MAGAADRTNLPDGACDAIFMRNVYHHFAAPGPMSASLAAALKPGGRLAVVDFRPPGAEAPTPADRDEDDMHGVTPESVRRELMDAGFQVERTETGSRPRVHGGGRPRHLTRPRRLRSRPATTPESSVTPESDSRSFVTTPESPHDSGVVRTTPESWNFLRRRRILPTMQAMGDGGPPRLAEWLLRRLIRASPAADAILGDLAEEHHAERRARGRLGAAAWYWRQAAGVASRRARRAASRPPSGPVALPDSRRFVHVRSLA